MVQYNLAQNKEFNKAPNILFILADDLGYADIGAYGATKVKTPNLDTLVSKGLRFTNYRTGASICSPSRAALLTGSYPQRNGLYMGINPKREAHWFLGLDPSEITIAEQCKTKNYNTFLVGKWHLGTEEKFSYFNQGFDEYYGMPCNYNQSTKFYDGKKLVYKDTPLEELTSLYTKRIKDYIEEYSSDKPFFLFYSHNYPHRPYKAGKRFQGSSLDGERGDVIQEFDWSVGEIIASLKKTRKLENTLIIFTSDNGPVTERYAMPYRGKKWTSLDGGHRVPFLISWKKGIKVPAEISAPMYAMDIFPTVCEIIGVQVPDDRIYDGVSVVPSFTGDISFSDREKPYYYYNCDNLQAVSYKHWKLHLSRSAEQQPWWDKSKEFVDISQPVLYNTAKDTAEQENVAKENPRVVQHLLSLAENARGKLGDYNQSGSEQRKTGTLFPDVPILGNPKDWNKLPEEVREKTYK